MTAKTKSRTRPATRIVVVSASAGGFEALGKLAAQLLDELPAVVFVVLHMIPTFDVRVLLRMLKERSGLSCELAQDGKVFRCGVI